MDAWRTSKLDDEKAKIRAEMDAKGELKGLSDAQINAKIEQSDQYKKVDEQYGVGSEFWRNGTAITGLLAGVLGGNVTGGMAAGAAPYVAGLIKEVTKGNEPARIALHTLASAVLVKAQGGNSAAGAAGGFIAASSSKALSQAFYGKDPEELSPEEKTVISNLVTALGAAGGSVAGGGSQGIGSGANAARVEVENNSLAHVLAAAEASKPGTIEKHQKAVKAACDESPEMCRQAVNTALGLAEDFTPGYGDYKSFKEAETAVDYFAAVIGILPGLGDAAGKFIKAAQTALKKGDLAEASKLINKVSENISGYLPKPGDISLPTSGVGSNAAFTINNAQQGKKLGKHVQDFGGNPSNAADRQRVLDIIKDIGTNPDKVIPGKFAGQGLGAGASRGDVFFRIKGNDVVVTKPDGSFVTILKDGVNNTSVKNALKGEPQ